MKHLLSTIILVILTMHAKAGIIVNNGLSHIYQIHAGEIIKGEITIENTSETSQTVKIYLQDVRYNASGTTFFTDPSGKATSNAGWIKLASNLITLKGKEKTSVSYEIHIPEDSLQKGSYWSTVMVEPTDNLSPNKTKGAITIQSLVRYAIQIITNNQTDDLKPNIKFDSVSITKINNKRFVNIAISNTGNLYFRPTAHIELYNRQSGEKAGTYNSIPMGILPGNAKSFQIDITNITPGKYSAVLMATDNGDNAFALNTVLDIKND